MFTKVICYTYQFIKSKKDEQQSLWLLGLTPMAILY